MTPAPSNLWTRIARRALLVVSPSAIGLVRSPVGFSTIRWVESSLRSRTVWCSARSSTPTAPIGEQLAAVGHRLLTSTACRLQPTRALSEALRGPCSLACRAPAHLRRIGPTQADLTPLTRFAELMVCAAVRRIAPPSTSLTDVSARRLRDMPQNNCADRPTCPPAASPREPYRHRAPASVPVGAGIVVYAVPGVPDEMQLMCRRLHPRSVSAARVKFRRSSRSVVEDVGYFVVPSRSRSDCRAPALDALDASATRRHTTSSLGCIDGLVGRITAKVRDRSMISQGQGRLRRAELRAILGDLVFGGRPTTRRWEHSCSVGTCADPVLGRFSRLGSRVTGGFDRPRTRSVPSASETCPCTIGRVTRRPM